MNFFKKDKKIKNIIIERNNSIFEKKNYIKYKNNNLIIFYKNTLLCIGDAKNLIFNDEDKILKINKRVPIKIYFAKRKDYNYIKKYIH